MWGVSHGEEAGQALHLQGKGMGKGCRSRQVLPHATGKQGIWTQVLRQNNSEMSGGTPGDL